MTAPRACPALFISAPASGQGKTTVTAALARRHRDRGRRVRVFKTGPDFLDPMILERASGHPVYQLDLFMGGEAHCRQLLYDAAGEADVILVEGVMGLFDGDPSGADLAARFGLPVLTVIDASAMAQTFGAVAHGLATYRADLIFAGVVANRVGGDYHARLLRDSLPADIAWIGALGADVDAAFPDRYLGLVQAEEVSDLDARISRLAEALGGDDLLPPPVVFSSAAPSGSEPLLAGRRIAVARDAAFAFVYPANVELLAAQGASIEYFSPLADAALPACDALWLPGGYPELFLDQLADNGSMKASIHMHFSAGKPILAECGGMLYLAASLTDIHGRRRKMANLIGAHAILQRRLAALGLQSVDLPEGCLRGHTFHHSRLETGLTCLARASNPNGGVGEAVYRLGSLTASYVHFYFPSNPQAVAALFLGREARA